jgi:essential nuclear protein 1
MFNKFIPAGEEPTLDLHASSSEEKKGTNLADLILKQIAAHEAQEVHGSNVVGGGPPEEAIEIPEKVIEVYSQVGMILSRYKSGKLPKPFKVLPSLPQWEDLISITRPESWTPNACYEATRIFVSANKKTVRRFIEIVLLDRVREDIHETKKLNVHLFQALRKATYKPEGFFKGFLFPLVESGTCTLREAHVVSGVLTRASIPVLHSAVALMRLTDIAAEQASAATEGGGATNIFIKTLLEKKYALPYKVIDNLVFHFLRFRGPNVDSIQDGKESKESKLPVIWHQTLLAFAQRYRDNITEDQREALLDLLLVRGHKDIGPEIRRELLLGRGRDAPVPEPIPDDGGDDTMMMDP